MKKMIPASLALFCAFTAHAQTVSGEDPERRSPRGKAYSGIMQ
jgi:hypothetical protein